MSGRRRPSSSPYTLRINHTTFQSTESFHKESWKRQDGPPKRRRDALNCFHIYYSFFVIIFIICIYIYINNIYFVMMMTMRFSVSWLCNIYISSWVSGRPIEFAALKLESDSFASSLSHFHQSPSLSALPKWYITCIWCLFFFKPFWSFAIMRFSSPSLCMCSSSFPLLRPYYYYSKKLVV